MKLKDKIALVTGSSRGIGKATALLLAQEGANVVINHLSGKEEALEAVKAIEKIGQKALDIECDVSQESEVKKMIAQAAAAFGKIDILVNNAGIVFDVPFSQRTVEHWKRTLEVNLLGTFLCSKYASEIMLKQKTGGAIVNISSTNGINSFSPDSMDYDASKAGIIVLTKDLAKELAPKIRVNSIAPGWVDTDMNKNLPEDFVKKEADRIYLKRFARPAEIAQAVLFLASDDASYITGSILKVDGGYS